MSCLYTDVDNKNRDRDKDSDNYRTYSHYTQMEKYEKYIKEQINYETLIELDYVSKDEVDSIVLIILDTLLCDKPTIYINGENKLREIVKSIFMKIDFGCIIYSINKFKEQKHKIKHKKAYLLTCLYNCKMEAPYNAMNYLNQLETVTPLDNNKSYGQGVHMYC